MSYSGYKKGSLSVSGAYAAFFTGFVGFGASYRFGIILILFYLTSSKLTKAGKNKKMLLEADYGTTSKRGAAQVIGSSIFATLLSVLFILLVQNDQEVQFSVLNLVTWQTISSIFTDFSGSWAAFWESKDTPEQQLLICSVFNCLYVAHYACATADTWASEVGILATAPPRLVTSLFLRQVPPGTNGGMSLLGTLASGLGGAFISTVYICMKPSYWRLVWSFFGALLAGDALPVALVELSHIWSTAEINDNISLLMFGLFCGLLGSLIDSVLGATCQLTLYSNERKCIVKQSDDTVPGSGDIVRICGVDLLSNEAVNLLSILLTMAVSVAVAPKLFA